MEEIFAPVSKYDDVRRKVRVHGATPTLLLAINTLGAMFGRSRTVTLGGRTFITSKAAESDERESSRVHRLKRPVSMLGRRYPLRPLPTTPTPPHVPNLGALERPSPPPPDRSTTARHLYTSTWIPIRCFNTRAATVGGCFGVEGRRGRSRREKREEGEADSDAPPLLTDGVPPTPSSGSFDLGSSGGSKTTLRRSRAVTPGGMTFTTISGEEFDQRRRPRVHGRNRPVSVGGSVQEVFGAGSKSGPPVPPPVAILPLQPAQQPPPTNTLPTATVAPTSVLGLGLSASPSYYFKLNHHS